MYLSLNCSLMHTHMQTHTCLTHSTVLSVFCPPLHSGEGKAEVSERQSKLRTNLDGFIENLMVSLHHLGNIHVATALKNFSCTCIYIVPFKGHCGIVTDDGSTGQNMEPSQGSWLIFNFISWNLEEIHNVITWHCMCFRNLKMKFWASIVATGQQLLESMTLLDFSLGCRSSHYYCFFFQQSRKCWLQSCVPSTKLHPKPRPQAAAEYDIVDHNEGRFTLW